jgi:transcriptional regulator with XRE-family HTH domain
VRSPQGFDRFLTAIGAAIATHRQRAGLTQESAANLAGIDYKRWQRIEAGVANITMRTLWRVAVALGVPPRELVAHADPR